MPKQAVPVVAVGQMRDVIDSRTSNSFVDRGLPLGQATALALGQQLRALDRNRPRLQLLTPIVPTWGLCRRPLSDAPA